MSDRSSGSSLSSNLRGLGWPLLWGMAIYFLFLLAIKKGLITSAFVLRYCAGHPVSHVTTAMFLVGLTALALKALDLVGQFHSLGHIRLPQPPAGGQPIDDSSKLLAWLTQLPGRMHRSYLWGRLHAGLQYVHRNRSADGLEDELKYLADLDGARQQESYALVRILIWATPMLGFLGTVIGITMALQDFATQDMSGQNLNSAMEVLLSGLYVAFDTTALALSLSIVLMFVQFLIDRFETQLLQTVDQQAASQLVGRFQQIGSTADPHARSIHQMCQAVLQATQQLVERQSRIWQATIEQAHQHWSRLSSATTEQLQAALAGALQQALEQHAERMEKVGLSLDQQLRQRWENWQLAMSDNARVMTEQQKEMVRQGEIINKVLQTTGEVIKLETALNENLKALAGARNFEDTVMSLAAAIHLLNTRLEPAADPPKRVELTGPASQGYAA